MSQPHEHEHAHAVRSEEDRIDSARIVAVGVAALVVFFLGSLAATGYLQLRQSRHQGPPIPAEVGQSKIGMVEQQLFELSVRGERDRAAKLRRLGSYGWVDREAGVVHLPIDEAMGLVLKGVRPMPVEPPPQPPSLDPLRTLPGGQP
jgi:hypothetical protein